MNNYFDNFFHSWIHPSLREDNIKLHLARFGIISSALGFISGLSIVFLSIFLNFKLGIIGSSLSLSAFIYFIIVNRYSNRVKLHAFIVLTVFVAGLQIGNLGVGSIISGLSLSYIILIRVAYYFDAKVGFIWSLTLLLWLLILSILEYFDLIPFSVELIGKDLHLFQLSTFIFFIIVAIVFLSIDKFNNERLKFTLDQNRKVLISHDKMLSLQRVTAGLAHELNNPVNFISNNVEALQLDMNDLASVLEILGKIKNESNPVLDNQLKESIQNVDLNTIQKELHLITTGIINGTNRITQIIQKLQFFIQVDQSEKLETNVNTLIDTAIEFVDIVKEKSIAISKNLSVCPAIKVHPNQIAQVFMNILKNAIQAIPENGEIHIATLCINNQVHISIKDNGKGMTETEITKIFDPFYTTNEVGEGLGLGLYIALGIIQAHEGTIKVESHVKTGSTFTIVLPTVS